MALAVSPPTVESLLFRARRELRARLRPVTGSAASVAPLAAIRDALARAIGGMPDPSAGALAGLASATPIAAKVAAGVAVVAVAGGTVAAVDRHAPTDVPVPPAPRQAVQHAYARPAVPKAVEAAAATPQPNRIRHPGSGAARGAGAVSTRAPRSCSATPPRRRPRRPPQPVRRRCRRRRSRRPRRSPRHLFRSSRLQFPAPTLLRRPRASRRRCGATTARTAAKAPARPHSSGSSEGPGRAKARAAATAEQRAAKDQARRPEAAASQAAAEAATRATTGSRPQRRRRGQRPRWWRR